MIGIIIGGIVLAIAIVVIANLKSYFDIINREFEPDEKILENKNSSKKALVLYAPSKHDSVDVVKNIAIKRLNEKGFIVHSNLPTIESNYNYDEFDVICYISPVYMGQVSKSLCETMVSSDYKGKKAIIISVGQAMQDTKELNYMKKILNQANEFNVIKVTKEDTKKLCDFIEGAIV